MGDPLVTIVIPTFNYGHFVVGAVQTALAQTYANVEVIVVDDGSTDGTCDLLAPYRGRVGYLYQSNQGIHAARNAGILAGRGEFIGFLDSDDLWHPRKVERQMQCFMQHPEAGLVAADTVKARCEKWPEVKSAALPAVAVTQRDLLICPRFGASSVLIRRECFQRVGMFEGGILGLEDRDMWIRIARYFPIYILQEPLWWYREHTGSISYNVALMEANELKVLRKAFAANSPASWRLLLRRKAISRALISSAHMYDITGMRFRALARLVHSFLLWPVPFRPSEVNSRFVRLKMFLLIIARLVRGAGVECQARCSSERSDRSLRASNT
jgi:glycosyltransferase involved in cell wall biosynthesis